MATYTVYIAFTGGKGSSVSFRYPTTTSTTGTGHTSSNPLELNAGDNVKFVETSGSTGGGTISGLDIFTDNSSFSYSGSGGTGEIADRTVATGTTPSSVDTITANTGVGSGSDNFYFKRVAGAITAPVISSVTNNNASAANVTTTVNLSSNGSGGTLKYAQTTSNSVPASGWQTGNTFSHPRGTTRYYWASQDEDTSGAFDDSGAVSVGYIAPDTAVSPSSATIAHDASSASITITGVTSGETYQLRSQYGTSQYQSGTASSTSITISQTGGLPSAGGTLTYQVFALRPTSLGGDGAYDATGDTYTITRSAAPVTTGSFDLSTDTITEGGSLTVQNISTSPSGGYHLKLFRNSGDSPDSISPVTKTWTGTSTADFTMSVANQSASEIGYQGESFTWLLREGTDTSGDWNGGASLDSADFTLYDDEHGTSISDSTIDISYTATSFTVGVISNWSGTNTVAARIRNTSTDTVVKTFNITTNNGTTNVSVTSGLPAAAGGSSSNYRVEVYNGNEYLNGATFSVTRGVETVTAPTDIAFGTSSTASATVSITATASGGSGGTLQVSENNSTWVANGSSFTFTRGTAKTIYARRTGSGANSSSYSESHTVGYLTGDTTVSATSSTIAFAATSASTTVSGGQSAETYAVRVNNGATNLGTRTGNGSISFSSSLPSGGNSTTYEIFVRRPISTGGDGSTFTATNDTFTVTRTAADTTPNDFSFTDFTNVARSTTQTSSTITVGGLSTGTSVAVSVTGGTYSKNSGSYTSSNGTASNGDTFSVRHTSSGSFSTNTDTTLTIGNKDDTFRTTTLAADTVPDAFSFTDAVDQPLGALTTSTEITVAGLNTSTTVSVTGGEYSKNDGTYTSSSGTASNGDTFSLRHTTSISYSTPTNTELNIGGVTDTWTTTTIAEGSTQTGGGGGSSTGSGSYGIEVYGPDGETVIWGSNVRQSNIVVYELLDLDNGTSKSYTCADANDDTKVKVVAAMPSYIAGPAYQNFYGGISVSKTSTGFTVTNSNSNIVEPSVEILVIAARVA